MNRASTTREVNLPGFRTPGFEPQPTSGCVIQLVKPLEAQAVQVFFDVRFADAILAIIIWPGIYIY